MLFSVIIPVYNRADVVERTLASVAAQSWRPLQVVLVDNDSTDDTRRVLERWADRHRATDLDIIVDNAPHHMAGAPRNRGADLATGDWLVFFDSDDEMHRKLLSDYADVITRHGGDLDIVSTRATLRRRDGSKSSLPFHRAKDALELLPYQILNSQLATQRYAVRREFFAATDGWNINVPVWNDWELGIRLLLAGPRVAYLNKTRVTVHDSGAASITGTNFYSKHGTWEHVIDIARLHVMLDAKLDSATRTRLLRLLEFKRMTLAGQYELEGRSDLARPLCSRAYAALRDTYGDSLLWRWWVAPATRWLFRRVATGGRGSATLARWLY